MPILISSHKIFNPLPFPRPPTAEAAAVAWDAAVLLRPNAGVATVGAAANNASGTTSDRSGLQLGVDQPTRLNTGALQPASQLIDVTGADVTYSTAGQTITGRNFLVDVFCNAANLTFRNCIFRGGTTTPGDGQGLVECKTANCSNILFEDCEFYPQFVHWNWDNALVGHDFTARRCWFHHTVDGVGIYNTTKPNGDWAAQGFASTPKPYLTHVRLEQCLIEDLAYWTAASTGVVHPSDNVTHNDAVQHQGGLGTYIGGNTIKGAYARNYGHWWRAPYPTGSTTVEPFTGVALQSLPAGNPTYGGPFQIFNSNTIPDRGNGNEAQGRYNVGGLGSLATFMIGDEVGPSGNLTFDRNWLEGGHFCVNGGGSVNRDYATGPAQTYTMTFLGNTFDNTQGDPSRTATSFTTQTINFQQGEDSWQGFVTAPTTGADANLYYTGQPIVVRT